MVSPSISGLKSVCASFSIFGSILIFFLYSYINMVVLNNEEKCVSNNYYHAKRKEGTYSFYCFLFL